MAFDPRLLGYPWGHPDPRVDRLQQDLQARVARCEEERLPRREVFAAVWRMAHEAAGRPAPNLAGNLGSSIPLCPNRGTAAPSPPTSSSSPSEPADP